MPSQDTTVKNTYTLSIEKAIKRGKFVVHYASISFLVLLTQITIVIAVALNLSKFLLTIVLTISIALYLIYKSIALTQWRIWAFTNVRNVHALKKYAQQNGLMPKDDSSSFMPDIRTANQKRKWEALRVRFLEDDIFIDDTSVKSETLILYSRAILTRWFALTLFLSAFGIFLITNGGSRAQIGWVFCILSVLFIALKFWNFGDRSPKIVLTDRGIKTERMGFYEWHQISDETVVQQTNGKYTHHYLSYTTPQGNEFLIIDDLAINKKELVCLLVLYRGRFEKNNNSLYR